VLHAHAVPIERSAALWRSGPIVVARVCSAKHQPRRSCNSQAEM